MDTILVWIMTFVTGGSLQVVLRLVQYGVLQGFVLSPTLYCTQWNSAM